VYASVRRLGVPASRQEDVTHDVFIIVHRKLQDYDPTRPIRPWLLGITYRVVLDHKRKASTTREIPTEGAGELAEVPAPTHHSPHEARDLVMRALDQVPLERRVVFILHKLDGCTVADIAREFALPLHTVYARLRKAGEEFTQAIREVKRGEEEAP
jgi:RNA polymerase sigma-70 factor (ECF subfamily)